MSGEELTCWSCDSYTRTVLGPYEYRHECGHPNYGRGCPNVGPSCMGFSYEPGSDEREAVE